MSEGGDPGCPVPLAPGVVTMAHGGGGRAMQRLLDEVVFRHVDSVELAARHDSAVLDFGGALRGAGATVAFTTDTYVVSPLFFPGGDIGRLAVFGTVNDLAMAGATPVAISLALLLEEGFSLSELERVMASVQAACREADVRVVTGDTKVVDRGKGDGIYVNTAGLGVVEHALAIRPASVRPGDAILVSGDLGRHGIALMACREGLEFETRLESDSAPLWEQVQALLAAGVEVRCLRDLTRGGLSSALVEIAEASGHLLVVDEARVPVHEEVRGACELLGLDPMYVANEGRLVTFVPPSQAERALEALASAGGDPCRVGQVEGPGRGSVRLRTALGVERPLDMLSGEQLPRIC